MNNFTSGPWTAERDPCHFDTLSSVRGGVGALQVEIGGKARPPEQEANTRLIAAAPDLFAACIAMLDWMENTEHQLGFTLSSAEAARLAVRRVRGLA